MRKLIGAINMTLDGFCDHTAGIADEELHQYYAGLMAEADAILYGRITYQLMEFWRTVLEKPTGDKAMDEFAVMIDKVPKIVFSRTLDSVSWKSARLAKQGIAEEVATLLQQPGKDIFAGSRSMIISLLNLGLLDELQICIHPVVIGKGLPLFEHLNNRTLLTLVRTKTFGSGSIVLYYQPVRESTNLER